MSYAIIIFGEGPASRLGEKKVISHLRAEAIFDTGEEKSSLIFGGKVSFFYVAAAAPRATRDNLIKRNYNGTRKRERERGTIKGRRTKEVANESFSYLCISLFL